MVVKLFDDKILLSRAAAEQAASAIRRAIASLGRARIVAATGVSQVAFLEELTKTTGIDWQRVEMFHLDEYVGLPITNPASFRKFLIERLIHKAGIQKYHLLDGDGDIAESVKRVGETLISEPIDVAFLGIGEN